MVSITNIENLLYLCPVRIMDCLCVCVCVCVCVCRGFTISLINSIHHLLTLSRIHFQTYSILRLLILSFVATNQSLSRPLSLLITHSLTHSLTHSHTLYHQLPFFPFHGFIIILACPLTQPHNHNHTHTHPHSHTHTQSLSLSHTHTHTHSLTHTHTHTHTQSLSLSHTHSHTSSHGHVLLTKYKPKSIEICDLHTSVSTIF